MAPSAASIIERDQIAWRARYRLGCKHDVLDLRAECGKLECAVCESPLLPAREVPLA